MIIDGNKYIEFALVHDTGKTQKWNVVNKSSGFNLGDIFWYGSWRQYIFEPSTTTIYNNGCLEVIMNFLTRINKEKKIEEK